MRNGLAWILGMCFFVAQGDLCAQTLTVMPSEQRTPPEKDALASVSSGPGPKVCPSSIVKGAAVRIWTQTDDLILWARSGQMPAPIVTAGDPTVRLDSSTSDFVKTAGAIIRPEALQLPPTAPSGPKTPGEKGDSTTVNSGPVAGIDTLSMAYGAGGYQIWARTDYLLWWVRNAPLPVPIVTTGNPNVGFDPKMLDTVNTAGAIGQPGTQVLLGGTGISFHTASGARLTLGGWLDGDQRLGLEGNGFVLAHITNRFAVASDSAGSPPLYFPIFSGLANAERAIPIADPLRGFSGDAAVTSTLQLWGAEASVLCTVYRCSGCDFSLLAGFRYTDLRESIQIHNTTKDLFFGNVTTLSDSFQTSNQFYGGQIGIRLGAEFDRFSLDITGKFAAGSAHQLVDIQGAITQAGPNPLVPPGLGTFRGGLFAQSSNIGVHDANPLSIPFMILPSLELKLAFQLTPHIRAIAGYDFLYWTQVLRPGNQINHNVNLSQNAVLDPNGVGTLVGPAQPAPLLNRSDFWAQGISFGLEFRY
jgi:Putative beta barrel porin-7 (BBP7)